MMGKWQKIRKRMFDKYFSGFFYGIKKITEAKDFYENFDKLNWYKKIPISEIPKSDYKYLKHYTLCHYLNTNQITVSEIPDFTQLYDSYFKNQKFVNRDFFKKHGFSDVPEKYRNEVISLHVFSDDISNEQNNYVAAHFWNLPIKVQAKVLEHANFAGQLVKFISTIDDFNLETMPKNPRIYKAVLSSMVSEGIVKLNELSETQLYWYCKQNSWWNGEKDPSRIGQKVSLQFLYDNIGSQFQLCWNELNEKQKGNVINDYPIELLKCGYIEFNEIPQKKQAYLKEYYTIYYYGYNPDLSVADIPKEEFGKYFNLLNYRNNPFFTDLFNHPGMPDAEKDRFKFECLPLYLQITGKNIDDLSDSFLAKWIDKHSYDWDNELSYQQITDKFVLELWKYPYCEYDVSQDWERCRRLDLDKYENYLLNNYQDLTQIGFFKENNDPLFTSDEFLKKLHNHVEYVRMLPQETKFNTLTEIQKYNLLKDSFFYNDGYKVPETNINVWEVLLSCKSDTARYFKKLIKDNDTSCYSRHLNFEHSEIPLEYQIKYIIKDAEYFKGILWNSWKQLKEEMAEPDFWNLALEHIDDYLYECGITDLLENVNLRRQISVSYYEKISVIEYIVKRGFIKESQLNTKQYFDLINIIIFDSPVEYYYAIANLESYESAAWVLKFKGLYFKFFRFKDSYKTINKVVVYNDKGLLKEIQIDRLNANIVFHVILNYLGHKPHRINKKLKHIQLSMCFGARIFRDFKSLGITIYSRTFAGETFDYCIVKDNYTFHHANIDSLVPSLRAKQQQIVEYTTEKLTLQPLLRENGGKFCTAGVQSFLQINDEVDPDKAYTRKELHEIIIKNKSDNEQFKYDLRLIGINI